MSNQYYVTAVRQSKRFYTDEGKHPDKASTIVKLAELGEE
jgi:hypothetical protein